MTTTCIKPPLIPRPGRLLKQYSPTATRTQTPSAALTILSITVKSQQTVKSQDPDGIVWIKPDQWKTAEWDGTPFKVAKKTKEEIIDWLCPTNSYVVRGLRERFYEIKPFADNKAPTVAEIDNWNIEVIKHFRRLLGVQKTVENNSRLYLEARWADERKHTKAWDKDYPGDSGTAYGPCWFAATAVDTAGGHCGESFFPQSADRHSAINMHPYYSNFALYPELNDYRFRMSESSGISSIDTDIPWSIKLATVIARFIRSEGLVGHAGPFVNPDSARQYFGCSWWLTSDSTTSFRCKWR